MRYARRLLDLDSLKQRQQSRPKSLSREEDGEPLLPVAPLTAQQNLHTKWVVFLTNSIDAADAALLPGIFRALEMDFGLSPKLMSVIGFSTFFFQSLFMPVWGILADRAHSRKSMLMYGCIAWGLLTLMVASSKSFGVLVALRTLNALALAMMSPLSQSVLADVVPTAERGRAFGALGFAGSMGGMVGGVLSTGLATATIWGVRGWRVAFVVVAVACLVTAVPVNKFMSEPPRGQMEQREREAAAAAARGGGGGGGSAGGGGSLLGRAAAGLRHVVATIDAPSPPKPKPAKKYTAWEATRVIFSTRTFLLLILQGTWGNMPWVALTNFSPLFFSYCGFSDAAVASLWVSKKAGGALGTLFSGWFGDRMHAWSPDHGRVMVAQATVALGLPAIWVVLQELPRKAESYWLFFAALFVFNFVSCWTPAATNRPVQTEIVDPAIRATIMSWQMCVEGMFSALGAPAVAYLSQDVFGYVPTNKPIAEMSTVEREVNADALAKAMLYTMGVPWALCFVFYSLMHFTYARDRRRYLEGIEAA